MMRELDTRELSSLALNKECPFCGGNRFFEGPHGGVSINWYCARPRCGAGFNLPPEPLGFGQLIAEPGGDVHRLIGDLIESAEGAISNLEKLSPSPVSAEGRLLAGLRDARDRYLIGAIPLRFGRVTEADNGGT